MSGIEPPVNRLGEFCNDFEHLFFSGCTWELLKLMSHIERVAGVVSGLNAVFRINYTNLVCPTYSRLLVENLLNPRFL